MSNGTMNLGVAKTLTGLGDEDIDRLIERRKFAPYINSGGRRKLRAKDVHSYWMEKVRNEIRNESKSKRRANSKRTRRTRK